MLPPKRPEAKTRLSDIGSDNFERGCSTTAENVIIQTPKLIGVKFATAIIKRCKRRKCSVEEALIEMCLAAVSVLVVIGIGIDSCLERIDVAENMKAERQGRFRESSAQNENWQYGANADDIIYGDYCTDTVAVLGGKV